MCKYVAGTEEETKTFLSLSRFPNYFSCSSRDYGVCCGQRSALGFVSIVATTTERDTCSRGRLFSVSTAVAAAITTTKPQNGNKVLSGDTMRVECVPADVSRNRNRQMRLDGERLHNYSSRVDKEAVETVIELISSDDWDKKSSAISAPRIHLGRRKHANKLSNFELLIVRLQSTDQGRRPRRSLTGLIN